MAAGPTEFLCTSDEAETGGEVSHKEKWKNWLRFISAASSLFIEGRKDFH